jgi:hypothetical protein
MIFIIVRYVAPVTYTPRDKQKRFFTQIKIKVKPSKSLQFKFKPWQVNDSSQSNQGTDHLISHTARVLLVVMVPWASTTGAVSLPLVCSCMAVGAADVQEPGVEEPSGEEPCVEQPS